MLIRHLAFKKKKKKAKTTSHIKYKVTKIQPTVEMIYILHHRDYRLSGKCL